MIYAITAVALWYLVGLGGGWLEFRNDAWCDAERERKYGQRPSIEERCPTPAQIIFIATYCGLLGPIWLLVAVSFCFSKYGMWYRRGRFAWWTTPICKKPVTTIIPPIGDGNGPVLK